MASSPSSSSCSAQSSALTLLSATASAFAMGPVSASFLSLSLPLYHSQLPLTSNHSICAYLVNCIFFVVLTISLSLSACFYPCPLLFSIWYSIFINFSAACVCQCVDVAVAVAVVFCVSLLSFWYFLVVFCCRPRINY